MGRAERVAALKAVPVLALALCAGGCIERDVSGGVAAYSFSWWVPVLSLVAVYVMLAAGLLLRRIEGAGRLGWGLVAVSLVFGIVITPSLFLDRVKVGPGHFETATGFWFVPNEHYIPFDGLAELRHVTYERRGRRGRKYKHQKFVCVRNDGMPPQSVPVGDLVRRASPEIIARARKHGVAVTAVHE